MARNQEPITTGELEQFQRDMEEQAEELRNALADELGGNPEDYRPAEVPEE